jgi:hypothetical protein
MLSLAWQKKVHFPGLCALQVHGPLVSEVVEHVRGTHRLGTWPQIFIYWRKMPTQKNSISTARRRFLIMFLILNGNLSACIQRWDLSTDGADRIRIRTPELAGLFCKKRLPCQILYARFEIGFSSFFKFQKTFYHKSVKMWISSLRGPSH